jgi:hypothetical protein
VNTSTHITMRVTAEEAARIHLAAKGDGSVSAYLRRLIQEEQDRVERQTRKAA